MHLIIDLLSQNKISFWIRLIIKERKSQCKCKKDLSRKRRLIAYPLLMKEREYLALMTRKFALNSCHKSFFFLSREWKVGTKKDIVNDSQSLFNVLILLVDN